DWTEVGQLRVIDTQKRGEVFVHRAAIVEGRAPEPGEAVRISVDADRRRAIQGHHTVTHLLHWALHEVVSRDASQKGSYVGPDKLTFDFSSAPLTSDQKRDVEELVNEKIAEDASVSWMEIPFQDAQQRKDIIQFFGETNGETAEILKQIDERAVYLAKIAADVRDWEKKMARTGEAELRSRAAQIANQLVASHAGKNLCVAEVANADVKLLQAVADALKPK